MHTLHLTAFILHPPDARSRQSRRGLSPVIQLHVNRPAKRAGEEGKALRAEINNTFNKLMPYTPFNCCQIQTMSEMRSNYLSLLMADAKNASSQPFQIAAIYPKVNPKLNKGISNNIFPIIIKISIFFDEITQ